MKMIIKNIKILPKPKTAQIVGNYPKVYIIGQIYCLGKIKCLINFVLKKLNCFVKNYTSPIWSYVGTVQYNAPFSLLHQCPILPSKLILELFAK